MLLIRPRRVLVTALAFIWLRLRDSGKKCCVYRKLCRNFFQVWFHFFNAQRKRCRQANALSEFFVVHSSFSSSSIAKPTAKKKPLQQQLLLQRVFPFSSFIKCIFCCSYVNEQTKPHQVQAEQHLLLGRPSYSQIQSLQCFKLLQKVSYYNPASKASNVCEAVFLLLFNHKTLLWKPWFLSHFMN